MLFCSTSLFPYMLQNVICFKLQSCKDFLFTAEPWIYLLKDSGGSIVIWLDQDGLQAYCQPQVSDYKDVVSVQDLLGIQSTDSASITNGYAQMAVLLMNSESAERLLLPAPGLWTCCRMTVALIYPLRSSQSPFWREILR